MTERLTIILDNGDTLSNCTVKAARAAGASEEAIEAAMAATTAHQRKLKLRALIERKVGEVPTLVGSLADQAGMDARDKLDEIVLLAAEAGNSYERARLARYKERYGDDVVAQAQALLALIDDGTIRLTADVKPGGWATALREGLERNAAAAAIFLAAG